MKVAIFGAAGLVGRSMICLLEKQNIDWVGTYHKTKVSNSYNINCSSKDEVYRFLKDNNCTHSINCIAERNVDLCEKDWTSAVKTNNDIAKNIAVLCKDLNIFFLHISTDYVFDGMAPPYFPNSSFSPLQAYGKSKAMAEDSIRTYNCNACIVRVPVLYTHRYNTLTETAITLIGKKVLDKTRMWQEDNYFIRRPVFIDDACVFLLSCLSSEKKGTYHFFNTREHFTKYSIAQEIARYLVRDIVHIQPLNQPSTLVGRPYDTNLLDNQYNRSEFPATTLSQGVLQCFRKLKHPILDLNSIPTDTIFYLLDLDGTILDTEKLHFYAYEGAFKKLGIVFCDWKEYQSLNNLEEYCKQRLGDSYDEMKKEKNILLYKTTNIQFIKGADMFLRWLIATKQNFAIVTNTSFETVQHFQKCLPLLQEVTKWVTRNDVTYPKPNPESYEAAQTRYFKGENYIIGFENTKIGYESLKNITPCIYFVTEYKSIQYNTVCDQDIYFVKDLTDVYISVPK